MTVQLPVPFDYEHKPIFSPQSQSRFLEHLSTNGNVRLACRAAGVSAQTAYRARRASSQFAALWDAALLSARQHAADVLADRALNGIEEKVFYHGEEVATRRRYSDRLLLAHLARLDKLEERADIAANLAVLDEAIDALGRGEELPQAVHAEPFDNAQDRPVEASSFTSSLSANGKTALRQAQGEREGGPADERNFPDMDPVPSVPSCRNSAVAKCPHCGGNCEDPDAELTEADCQWLGNRLEAMDAARPEGARLPHELARDHPHLDTDDIESVQLAAFEAGAAQWWLVVPTTEEWEDAGGNAIPLSRLGGEEYYGGAGQGPRAGVKCA